jgi:hypothetical protein
MGLMGIIIFFVAGVMVCPPRSFRRSQLTLLDVRCLDARCSIRPRLERDHVRQFEASKPLQARRPDPRRSLNDIFFIPRRHDFYCLIFDSPVRWHLVLLFPHSIRATGAPMCIDNNIPFFRPP